MIVDPAVVPGLLLLLAELAVLAAVGYVVVRVALRQDDDRMALAQGLVVGLALWGLITNFVLYAVPGLAGAAVGWGVTLALGAVLVWRAPDAIRPRPRVAAGFAVAVLALFWMALASRQVLSLSDPQHHLGMAAMIRAGGFPPELPWNPGEPLRYHHASELLVGLLTPPVGPDLGFGSELLDAYAWMSFALVVVTALLPRGSWRIALLLAPLLLTAGAWTWTSAGNGILQGPVPAGLPEAGLRASLGDIYWPAVGESWAPREAGLPNIWKSSFPLAYALVLIVLERLAGAKHQAWPVTLALAALVGFLGLLSTTLAPVVLGLWAALEAVRLGQARRVRALAWRAVLRPGTGLALAVLLLLAGGGVFTGLLDGAGSSNVVFWWSGNSGDWRLLGVFEARPGGVGLLAIGPVVAAAIAAVLARRDPIVLALAVGAVLLAVAGLVLRYTPFPQDLDRLAGHARNFALAAVLLALSGRLAGLRPRWRYGASALLVGLVIWPTSSGPIRNLALALGQGVEVANAGVVAQEADGEAAWGPGRFVMPAVSPRIVAYIRDHTPLDARVLVPEESFWKVSAATGRPNSSGYANVLHSRYALGPEYLDARDYLEPGAMRRLGIDYIYATDDWAAGLPDRARRWLTDPEYVELLIRDGVESLYRLRPAFLALNVPPTPASFEALRQAVPVGTAVYWPAGTPFERDTTLRVASVLSPEAQLFGVLKYALRRVHALTPLPTERLGTETPDLVLVPVGLEPSVFPPEGRQPIWWNHEMAIYAPNGAIAPIMPPLPEAEPRPVRVQVSDARVVDGRMAFTVTIDDHSPDRWTGQDWVLISVDESPWAIPTHLEADRRTPLVEQWFAGQVIRGRGTTTHGFAYDARTSSLAVRSGDGTYRTEQSSAGTVSPGAWTLALRLRREVDRGTYLAQEEAALIPVLKVTVTADGEVSYAVHDAVRDG